MRLLSRLPFPALAAVGLVVAGVALTPGGAAASCGSYVTIQGHTDAGGPIPPPAVPCHGPGCSKAPANPPALPLTAPVSSSQGSEQPSAHSDSSADFTAGPRWGRFPSVNSHPVRVASPIFHPPRAS
jgi:hypothetical protein